MSIVGWARVDHHNLPPPEDRLLLTDGENVEIGGFLGAMCLVESDRVPEDWMPTHYAEITLP
jgi:hypothetical protein